MIADGPIKVVKGYSRCSPNSMKCNISEFWIDKCKHIPSKTFSRFAIISGNCS